jgi:L-rhamnonate dehydratase
MRITDVRAVYPKWARRPRGVWQSHFWQIVVEVRADTGVIGLGYGGGGPPAVEVVNSHFRELLVGRTVEDVDDIRELWDFVYLKSLPYGRKGIPVMALSGVDLALWDLVAKSEGRPVYELIGGLRKERVRAYASTGEFERDRDAGFTAVKFSTQWTGHERDYDDTVETAARAREVFGPDALVMSDCYMSWDSVVSIEMARLLEPYGLYWFEDVLTPDDLPDAAALRPRVKPVLLAGGEHEFTHHGFAAVAQAGALDIWQPDLTWCGGITAGLRILELAQGAGVSVVPHRGGEIWGLHFIAATGCEDLAETHPERWEQASETLWLEEPHPEAGFITTPDRPGFGVVLDEAML